MAEPLLLEPMSFILPVSAANAGLFVSAGRGTHPTRVIDSWELIYVRSGRLDMFEAEQRFSLGPGEGLLLEPGRQHGGAAPYPDDLSFFWLHFRRLAVPGGQAAGLELRLPKCGRAADPEDLTELLRRFLAEQERGGLFPLRGALLLAEILAVYAQTQPVESASAGQTLANRARQLIATQACEGLTTAELARQLRCNPDYLGRVFKLACESTPTEAILAQRLKRAKRLLLDGAENVDEVRRQCGFASATHFRRIFKRQTGLTPQAFRRRYAPLHVNSE